MRVLLRSSGTMLLFAAVVFSTTARDARAGSPLIDKFSFAAGTFVALSSSQIQLNSADTEGTRLHLEEDLGLRSRNNVYRLEASWLFAERHEISAISYKLGRETTTTTSRRIIWGGKDYPAGTSLHADTAFDTTGITYTWWAITDERRALGASLGLMQQSIDVAFDIPLDRSSAMSAKSDAPVPMLGVEYRFAPVDRLRVRLPARFIYVTDVGGYRGRVIDLTPAVEYQIGHGFHLGAGYDRLVCEIRSDRHSFDGNVRYGVSGFTAYVRYGGGR